MVSALNCAASAFSTSARARRASDEIRAPARRWRFRPARRFALNPARNCRPCKVWCEAFCVPVNSRRRAGTAARFPANSREAAAGVAYRTAGVDTAYDHYCGERAWDQFLRESSAYPGYLLEHVAAPARGAFALIHRAAILGDAAVYSAGARD